MDLYVIGWLQSDHSKKKSVHLSLFAQYLSFVVLITYKPEDIWLLIF